VSDKGKVLTDVIFKMFDSLYRATMQGLAKSAPHEVQAAFVTLIQEARKRSGLPPEKTLSLLKYLRRVLDEIIEREQNQGNLPF
jgi:hypothetical protein